VSPPTMGWCETKHPAEVKEGGVWLDFTTDNDSDFLLLLRGYHYARSKG
jgi:hypothetical protein